MYMYPIFPDEVEFIINFLETHPYIVDYSPVTVASDLTGYVSPNRWISVQATGGNKLTKQRVSASRVDVNVYAESKPVAKRIALATVAALESIKGHSNLEAVVINADVSLPSDLTDPVNSNPRFVFDATITIRPK
jgi:predicted DNA-binding ArsR family transcriptional regulator